MQACATPSASSPPRDRTPAAGRRATGSSSACRWRWKSRACAGVPEPMTNGLDADAGAAPRRAAATRPPAPGRRFNRSGGPTGSAPAARATARASARGLPSVSTTARRAASSGWRRRIRTAARRRCRRPTGRAASSSPPAGRRRCLRAGSASRRRRSAARDRARPRPGRRAAVLVAVAAAPRRAPSSMALTSVMSSVLAMKCGPPSNGSMRSAYSKPMRRSIFSTPLVSGPTWPMSPCTESGRSEMWIESAGNSARMNSLFDCETRSASWYDMPGEVAAERLPQQRRAVGLERRQQLRQHLVAERRAVQPDVEEAHVGEPLAERLGLAPIARVQHEPADLRRAVVVVADAQDLVDEVLVERLRVALVVHHVEEDVRRAAGAVLRVDHRGADDLASRSSSMSTNRYSRLKTSSWPLNDLLRVVDQLLEDRRDRWAG